MRSSFPSDYMYSAMHIRLPSYKNLRCIYISNAIDPSYTFISPLGLLLLPGHCPAYPADLLEQRLLFRQVLRYHHDSMHLLSGMELELRI